MWLFSGNLLIMSFPSRLSESDITIHNLNNLVDLDTNGTETTDVTEARIILGRFRGQIGAG